LQDKVFSNLATSVQYFAKLLEDDIPLVPLVKEKGNEREASPLKVQHEMSQNLPSASIVTMMTS